jgi:dTDP-glucose 4,6-dehydratase
MPKRVLLTGHGGFVGSHCLEYFLEKTDWEIICIDSFRHKGTVRRVVETVANNPRVKTYVHDLTVPIDPQLENLLFERWLDNGIIREKPIHYIINMASESAVERSVTDPISCMNNNWHLGVNMLEFARKSKGLELFVQISTDEVYGEAPKDSAHKEWSPIVPSNPYAASKAAQEAIAISYFRSFNLPIVITNCMNLIGERQDVEKFLPKIVKMVAMDQEMPIYGDSISNIGTRIYLHCKCLADALIFISKRKPTCYLDAIKQGQANIRPDRYNICGDQEINNLELAQMVAKIMGKPLKYRLIPSESARPGYDRRYALDGSKLRNLGWTAPMNLEESLEKIVAWTLANPHWLV